MDYHASACFPANGSGFEREMHSATRFSEAGSIVSNDNAQASLMSPDDVSAMLPGRVSLNKTLEKATRNWVAISVRT